MFPAAVKYRNSKGCLDFARHDKDRKCSSGFFLRHRQRMDAKFSALEVGCLHDP